MAHILCITSGLTGILHASFEMVAQLKAAGHQVTCASPKDVGAKVRAQGFDYVQLDAQSTQLVPQLAVAKNWTDKLMRMSFKMRLAKTWRQIGIDNLKMDSFKKVLAEVAPDFIIVDVELHEHIMTIFSMKMPMILLSQWFSLWKRPGLPPLLHDTIPEKHWRGSTLGLEFAWLKIKVQRWWMFKKKRCLSVGTDRRSLLQAYAKQVGFPLSYIKENYWPGPFTYGTLPVISITAEELEFPHSLRPNLHYVGPMVYAQRKEVKVDFAVQQQLTAIFEQVNQSGQSLLYCSVSTFKKGDQQFLKKLIQAVGEQKNWVMILGMGGLLEKDSFDSLPKNVYPFAWIPQLQVLAKAHCSINHGGIHTINECIHFKVPMLVYSGKRSDQNGCAARVAYHGLGIMADKDKDDTAAIQRNIQSILSDPSFREKMQWIHQQYRKYQTEQKLNTILQKMM